MHIIRCTSKLLRELGVAPSRLVNVEHDALFGSWFANLIRWEKRGRESFLTEGDFDSRDILRAGIRIDCEIRSVCSGDEA